jgi:hypothetical protein
MIVDACEIILIITGNNYNRALAISFMVTNVTDPFKEENC